MYATKFPLCCTATISCCNVEAGKFGIVRACISFGDLAMETRVARKVTRAVGTGRRGRASRQLPHVDRLVVFLADSKSAWMPPRNRPYRRLPCMACGGPAPIYGRVQRVRGGAGLPTLSVVSLLFGDQCEADGEPPILPV